MLTQWAIPTIGIYSGTDYWRVGLNALSLNRGSYRWSNGRVFDLDSLNISINLNDGPEVRVPRDDHTEWMATGFHDSDFVCEQGTGMDSRTYSSLKVKFASLHWQSLVSRRNVLPVIQHTLLI